ncbi:MAG: M20/M25/M40 family metallo-hydrolase [Thermovirgaceae bacterium]
MIKASRESILQLILDLVKIPGVTRTPEELETGRFIRRKLETIPWVKTHPESVIDVPLAGDPFGRSIVGCLLKAKPQKTETVILTGHYDVVGVGDFGPLRHLAFSPLEYTRALADAGLEGEVLEDLASGEYLFGRGIMDMKAGLAVEMALLAEASESPGTLGVNLLFLAVPDEEDSSRGMRRAVSFLSELQEQEGLTYKGAILTEPSSAGAPKEAGETVFTGTAGKLMPFFYCLGAGSHVGQYFRGLNATLLASCCNNLMEANPGFTESVGEEKTPPPACLFMRDIRRSYSVTLPDRAVAFYNLMTLRRRPAEIVKDLKSLAEKAFSMALDHLERSAQNLGAGDYRPHPPKVMTFEEFVSETGRDVPDLKNFIRETVETLDEGLDDREKSLAVLDALCDRRNARGPMIIVGFLPPWYPHRENAEDRPSDRLATQVARKVAAEAKGTYKTDMGIRGFFGGICDLSYLGYRGSAFDPFCIAANMPGWGSVYRLPVKELMALDIPVLNIGVSGKDPHKPTERLHLPYTLDVLPGLLRTAITAFAEGGAS